MPDERRGPRPPSTPPLGGDRDIDFRRRRSWWRRHLSAIAVVVAAVLVVGGVTGAVLATRNYGDVAAPAAPTGSPSSASAAPTSKAPTVALPPVAKTKVSGTVVAVLAVGRWTVEVQRGQQLSVNTTRGTTYAQNRNASDVRKGTEITVTGTISLGVVTAQTVAIGKKKRS